MGEPLHPVRFPGETDAYRKARNALLRAEIALRAQIEEVAALRRALPVGGLVQDYEFEEGGATLDDRATTRKVKLSELFTPGRNTLVVYSFMYGPKAAQACPMCTALLDGINGSALHLAQRVDFVVVAKSPIARIREFARERSWSHMRLLSCEGTTFNRDYHAETLDERQLPALNVFVRRDDGIHHMYNTEVLYLEAAVPGRDPVKVGIGQDPRHIDLLWPLWNILDLTPEGRGTDWYPRLEYRP